MWFWIFAIISVGLIAWWIYNTWYDNWNFYETKIGQAFMTLLAVACGFGLIVLSWWASMGLGVWLTPDFEEGETTSKDLVAVATKDTIEGRMGGSIFASYGYVQGVRTISFLTKNEDGAIQVGQVYAQNSYVYEGDEDPRMETHHWFKENGWFFPFGVLQEEKTYSFYVPTGSVADGYEIAP